ncbi:MULTISPECIES: hypothetical protein [Herbaspirillum]|uniref:hypothetical protein n=1 Tax=Herbaspirillum TaxID=963 RepID=UPI0005C9DE3D|nr:MULTISPECIES: hypothetical protein [Herbaspirillum]MCP1576858.1 hypothetical protein [Herbaspirillum rubrisubalbicans]NQE49226.1 hypothetical protein [Herbaspirillum rubrisubalbicans]
MKNLLLLLSVLSLPGCSQPEGTWQATQDVTVFKAADEADEPAFLLRKGETCALGREQIVKAFMYREVSCPQGKGWIIYEAGYPFVRKNPPPSE